MILFFGEKKKDLRAPLQKMKRFETGQKKKWLSLLSVRVT